MKNQSKFATIFIIHEISFFYVLPNKKKLVEKSAQTKIVLQVSVGRARNDHRDQILPAARTTACNERRPEFR